MTCRGLPAATEGLEVSGDFYDVFRVTGGWAIIVGDVCGKGQEAAAMTAAARHAIRVIAHWSPDPADVLAKVNEVILAGDYEDRFVTVKLAYLRWEGGRLHVVWRARAILVPRWSGRTAGSTCCTAGACRWAYSPTPTRSAKNSTSGRTTCSFSTPMG